MALFRLVCAFVQLFCFKFLLQISSFLDNQKDVNQDLVETLETQAKAVGIHLGPRVCSDEILLIKKKKVLPGEYFKMGF